MTTESQMTTEADIKKVGVCSFCQEIVGISEVSLPLLRDFFDHFRKNRILMETHSLFIVPSLGALIRGHVLVLPKKHYYSVGEIPASEIESFESTISLVRRILSKIYGSCSAFEHGCVEAVSKAGACIDHAHLHLLPLNTDLRDRIDRKFGPGIPIHSLAELKQFFVRSIPYLYYESPTCVGRAYEATSVPSQYFRQLVSVVSPDCGHWDWKADVRLQIVKQTYDDLKDAFGALEQSADAA